MTHHEAVLLVEQIWLEYVFLGLFICAIARVDKWTMPWAIFGVMLLWPVLIAKGMVDLFREVFSVDGRQ